MAVIVHAAEHGLSDPSRTERRDYIQQLVCHAKSRISGSVIRQALRVLQKGIPRFRLSIHFNDAGEAHQRLADSVEVPFEEYQWENEQTLKIPSPGIGRASRFQPSPAASGNGIPIGASGNCSRRHLPSRRSRWALSCDRSQRAVSALRLGRAAARALAAPSPAVYRLSRMAIRAEVGCRRTLLARTAPGRRPRGRSALAIPFRSSGWIGPRHSQADDRRADDKRSRISCRPVFVLDEQYRPGRLGILVSRYSGTDEIVLGSIRAGRHAEGAAPDMVGMLINTVPMRVRAKPAAILSELLRDLRQQQQQIRAWENTPLPIVARAAGLSVTERLFTTYLMFESSRSSAEDEATAAGREFIVHEQTEFLNLSAHAGDNIRLILEYHRLRYSDSVMERMLGTSSAFSLRCPLPRTAVSRKSSLSRLPLRGAPMSMPRPRRLCPIRSGRTADKPR